MTWFSIISGSFAVFIIALATSGMPLRKRWGKYQPVVIASWLACLALSWLFDVDAAGWFAIPLLGLAGYCSFQTWQWSRNPNRFRPKV